MVSWPRGIEDLAETVVTRAGYIVARLATFEDRRLPLAWTADAFFLAMFEELERQGVPQRVVADMLGVSTRTLQRRAAAAREAAGARRRSEWLRVHDALVSAGPMSREALAARLQHSNPVVLGAILRDMSRQGWVQKTDEGLTARPVDDQLLGAALSEVVNLLRLSDPDITPEEVARRLRRPVAEVRDVWSDERLDLKPKTSEGYWHALALIADEALRFLQGIGDNADERHRMQLWELDTTGREELIPLLKAATTTAHREISKVFQKHARQHESADSRARWSLLFLETLPRVGGTPDDTDA